MKNIWKYIIVVILLLVIILTSAYLYRVDDKDNRIDTLKEENIPLEEEKEISFIATRNNLNKIKLNIEYQLNDHNQEIQVKVWENNKQIKEEIVDLKELQTFKSIYINLSKLKDSENKEYKITITPKDKIDCTITTAEIMYYQRYHMIAYIVLLVVVTITTLTLLRFLLNAKKIKIEKWYLILSILVYGTYILAFPVFTSHDEFYHWGRAYEISEGHLTSEIRSHQALTMVPKAVISVYNRDFHDIKYETTIRSIHEKIIKNEDTLFNMKTVAVYSPIQYLPQVIGIVIVRFFTGRTLFLAYAARIMNAIISIILMYLAIKLIPFGKRVLFTIAFIPITIEGFTSMSADALTISISILLFAYVLYLKYNKDIKILEKKHYIFLLMMSIVIALCKIVYIPLIFILLLISKEKFKNKKHRLWFIISIIGISVLLNLIWLSIASTYLKLYDTTGLQVTSILTHPISFIQIFFYTLLRECRTYLYSMFGYNIGWGEVVPVHSIIPFIFMLLMALNIFSDKDINKKTTIKDSIILGIIVFLIVGLIFTSLYIQFTPLGFKYILGVQGRYFLPFLPLMVIPISKMNIEYKGKLNLDLITIITCLLLNISVILTLFETFI